MRESQFLIIDLKVSYWLQTGLSRGIGIIQKYLDLWKDLLSYLGALLNFIILVSYSDQHGPRNEDPQLFKMSTGSTEFLLRVIGIITSFLIFIIFFNLLAIKIPIKIRRYQVVVEEKNKKMKETGTFKDHGVESFYRTFIDI